jgi:hypothetical protein
MDKPGKKVRDIRFFSEKNQKILIVHSEGARAYSKYLEDREEVESYEVGKLLDEGRLQMVSRVDIRGEYISQEWTSDFVLKYRDGITGVREIIRPSDLEKRAEVEKLELSRRYWTLMGVKDWKVVVLGK